MSDTVIADFPPADGRNWEPQCARCGSSAGRIECESCCGGECPNDLQDDYPFMQLPTVPCDVCDGQGGWYACLGTPEWCEAHPYTDPARNRGQIEWYVDDREDVT